MNKTYLYTPPKGGREFKIEVKQDMWGEFRWLVFSDDKKLSHSVRSFKEQFEAVNDATQFLNWCDR